jgi:hypothetical protein
MEKALCRKRAPRERLAKAVHIGGQVLRGAFSMQKIKGR